MFPSFQIAGMTWYMTGIGIVVAIFVYIVSMWYYTRRYGLSFGVFFYSLPVLIVLTYFLGGWSYAAIENSILYPANIQDLINIITPFEYKFHFVGIAGGFTGYIIRFLYTYAESLSIQKRRIDTFVVSLCVSMIPLGFFLLLGDDFIGKENQYGLFSVSALTPDSELAKYVRVYPIGLGISLIGLVGWLLFHGLKYISKKSGQGRLCMAYFLGSLCVIFIFQTYPRHGVWTLSQGIVLDIKNYICILGVVGSFICRYIQNRKYRLF